MRAPTLASGMVPAAVCCGLCAGRVEMLTARCFGAAKIGHGALGLDCTWCADVCFIAGSPQKDSLGVALLPCCCRPWSLCGHQLGCRSVAVLLQALAAIQTPAWMSLCGQAVAGPD
jgi:hypothetical protein